MRVNGLRIHIAGSANGSTDKNLIAYTHRLIEELVRSLSQEGATFVVGVGREPRSGSELDGPAIIFDWTVIAAAAESLRQGYASVKGPNGPLIATVQTTKTDVQIPNDRRELWQSLLSAGAIQSLALEPGWTSGALRRTRLAEIGEVLEPVMNSR